MAGLCRALCPTVLIHPRSVHRLQQSMPKTTPCQPFIPYEAAAAGEALAGKHVRLSDDLLQHPGVDTRGAPVWSTTLGETPPLTTRNAALPCSRPQRLGLCLSWQGTLALPLASPLHAASYALCFSPMTQEAEYGMEHRTIHVRGTTDKACGSRRKAA